MVIPQFGIIIRLLRYCWFYKQKLLVVLSITIFIVLLGVVQSSYQYFSKFFVGLPCIASCWVDEYPMSRSLILLAHYDLLVLSWRFQGWVILKQKETFKDEVGDNTRSFQDVTFFVLMEVRWERFLLENQNEILSYFERGKQNLGAF
jgi:hypothetical protein